MHPRLTLGLGQSEKSVVPVKLQVEPSRKLHFRPVIALADQLQLAKANIADACGHNGLTFQVDRRGGTYANVIAKVLWRQRSVARSEIPGKFVQFLRFE